VGAYKPLLPAHRRQLTECSRRSLRPLLFGQVNGFANFICKLIGH
jgi:hypothetical protein